MGCSASRIDRLPAVSLCHDRCKFLDEALRQSYALADAHEDYMRSLKTVGPTLYRFFDQSRNDQCDSNPKTDHTADVETNPSKHSSPDDDHCPCPSSSKSDSHSHLDFTSDSEEEEEDGESDFLHKIHPHYFTRQTPTPSRSVSFSYNHDHFYQNKNRPSWLTPSPPPPISSTWDFLNFFESYERYEVLTKNREEVRRDLKHEVDKDNKDEVNTEEENKATLTAESEIIQAAKTTVALEKEQSKEKYDSAESNYRSRQDVIKEVEVLFERAAESGNGVLKILDTGTFRHYHKTSVHRGVSSKMLHTVTPSFQSLASKNTQSLSSTKKNGSVNLGSGEASTLISVNLSYTLKKLFLWEEKLYDEVKAEEKLRILYAKNCAQMKSLGEKGMHINRIDSTQILLGALSTKIRVAIQVIDKISIAINKLRDEELWPQISDLSTKLLWMWKDMLACHRRQFQVILEAKNLNVDEFKGKFSDNDQIETVIELKMELQIWSLSFSNWISAQKHYVKALNGWLMRFLPSEPEEALDDDVPPSSASKMGAPLVFVFCSQWSYAVDRISEMEVIDGIHAFVESVNQLLERHYAYIQQRVTADKDMERKLKFLERKERRMQKVIQARGKKMFLAGRDASGVPLRGVAVRQSEITNTCSLQLGLKQIFIAIERFCTNAVKAYEELHVHIEEVSNPEKSKAP